MTHEEFVDSFRQIADFYEQHPNCPLPFVATLNICSVEGVRGLAGVAREFGECTKDFEGNMCKVSRQFGEINLQAIDWKENVCKRIVTGTHEERVEIPLTFEEHIRMVEDVRWECPDSLLEKSNKEVRSDGNS